LLEELGPGQHGHQPVFNALYRLDSPALLVHVAHTDEAEEGAQSDSGLLLCVAALQSAGAPQQAVLFDRLQNRFLGGVEQVWGDLPTVDVVGAQTQLPTGLESYLQKVLFSLPAAFQFALPLESQVHFVLQQLVPLYCKL
jgi:hypothetical protein